MAIHSVHEWIGAEQGREYVDLEERSYRAGCEHSRNVMIAELKAIDDELLSRKPRGWSVVGMYDRTMVMRFGDVTVRRRLYRDSEGETVFALDERMGWKPQQLASPSIAERVVEMATDMPFRKVSETVSALTAGVLSPNTVHRLLQSVGEDALCEERERWERQFERGEDMSAGLQRQELLYTEADGVWIHLQREDRKHYELKCGIAYRGWREVAGGRYELVGKRVYAHAQESIPFWEGASLEWGKQYALDAVKRFVVGGDGANWIRQGAYELPNSEFQLDGFHLARACGRGYGKKLGRAIYEAIRSGDSRQALSRMERAAPARTRTSAKDRRYVECNVAAGVDWRNRVLDVPIDARSLGTMESNGDKLTANRMKKRGMSWTIRGANHMAKTIQLCRNQDLSRHCHTTSVTQPDRSPARLRSRPKTATKPRTGDLPEVSMPALVGPHSARPWATSLKRLAQYPYLVI